MKTTILKGKWLLIDNILALAFIDLTLIIIYISFYVQWGWEREIFLVFFVSGIGVNVLMLFAILIMSKYLWSQITVSEKGINWTFNRKDIIFIEWEDVLDISVESRMMERNIVLKLSKKIEGFRTNELFFDSTKDNIYLLKHFCKVSSLSQKIEDVIYFQEYRCLYWLAKKRPRK